LTEQEYRILVSTLFDIKSGYREFEIDLLKEDDLLKKDGLLVFDILSLNKYSFQISLHKLLNWIPIQHF
jgi:hypothetical protein